MADVNIDLELITKQFDQALNKSLRTVQQFSDKSDKNFERLNKSIQQTTVETNKLSGNFSKSFSLASASFASFVGNVAANVLSSAFSTLTDSIVGFGTSAINNAKNIENLTTQFSTLTGSVESADKVITDLQQFAANTPFQLEGLAKTSSQLLSFGFTVDDILPRLQSIGDVAAATGSSVEDIGLIFGQISAAGKLTGERLLQLQERGIPILAALGEQSGKTQAEVRQLVTDGKVDFATFQKAFDSLSQAGGIAFEGMIRRSQTLDGVLSTLGDNFSLFSANIGKTLLPVIKSASIEIIKFIQSIDVSTLQGFVRDGISGVVIGLQSIVSAANPVINSFRFIGNVGLLVFDLLKSGVVGFQIAVTGSFLKIVSSLKSLINSLPQKLIPDGWAESVALFEETTQESFDTLVNSGSDLSDKLSQGIDNIGSSFDNMISDSTISNIQTKIQEIGSVATEGARAIDGEIVKSGESRLAKQKEQANREIEQARALEQEKAKVRLDAENNRKILLEENRLAELERRGVLQEEDLVSLIENEQAKLDIQKQKELEKIALIEDSAKRQIETEKILADFQTKSELSKLNQQRKFQSQRESNLRSSLGTIGTLQQNAAGAGFEIGKAANIAIATTDGIAAVQKALASAPPPFNFAIAALVGAASAANLAKLASAQPPKFQQGGIVPGSSIVGDKITANVNSGEMILNRNQQAELFNQANGGGGSSSRQDLSAIVDAIRSINIRLIANDNEIARSASRGVSNGVIIGESE